MSELEQFCILAKTQKGRACAALIQQVISNKKIFVYGELLSLPSVQALRETEYAKYLNTLELFAYGCYSDYTKYPENFLELNEIQSKKLKQLSIVSLAKEIKIIPYSKLNEVLEIENIRELEDLVIDTIYNGLIKAKLDQRAAILRIKDTVSRDVRQDEISQLINKLCLWSEKCRELQDELMINTSLAGDHIKKEKYLHKNMMKDIQLNTASCLSGNAERNARHENYLNISSTVYNNYNNSGGRRGGPLNYNTPTVTPSGYMDRSSRAI